MESPVAPYVALLLGILTAVGLAAVILVLNRLLGPRRSSPVKDSPFECGSLPLDTPRKRVSVRFYAVAIFFLVFDLEVVFLLPWAVLYRELLASPIFGPVAFAEIVVFLGVLALGLWFVWGKGALDWAFDTVPAKRSAADD
ncbi:MAG TPA: NADH-quinone oxidoreductase subunit A [Myxococcota bacterium]|mgnify:CR=1 FL=1|nr:NADH-quinone oxidoreductase subunit A [Myxococcota bacterium]HQK50035.1 NADH-quinone oxidoreductase subunit A [Myxococcota bacterium]